VETSDILGSLGKWRGKDWFSDFTCPKCHYNMRCGGTSCEHLIHYCPQCTFKMKNLQQTPNP
jgi:hypothetical protein